MNEVNGQSNGLPSGLVAPNTVSPEQAITIVEQALGPTMTIVLQGLRASFPGVPPQLIMLAACKVLGRLVGGTFAGSNAPLAPLMKARTECKEMFERSIKEIPFNAVGGGSGPPVPLPPGLKPTG